MRLLGTRLEGLGFRSRHLRPHVAENLFAEFRGSDIGNGGGGLLILGHTDVVSPGDGWFSPAFYPTVRDDALYGRGASDMKGPLAAIVVALEQLFQSGARPRKDIALLLTSDEEQNAYGGTEAAVKLLREELARFRYALVAEPSSDVVIGDRIKLGARGKVDLTVVVRGVPGHTGYSKPSQEAIVIAAKVISRLVGLKFSDLEPWTAPDNTTPHFTNIHSGIGATNAVDAECTIDIEFRTSPMYPLSVLRAEIELSLSGVLSLADKAEGLNLDLSWTEVARPWFSESGALVSVVDTVLLSTFGRKPLHSISGGTGDARFLPDEIERLELGPCTAANNIHAANEMISLADLDALVGVYKDTIFNMAF
jgi:succinyl-diaminopimelate desuccinylase